MEAIFMNAVCTEMTPKILSRRDFIDQLAQAMPGKSQATYIMKLQQMTKDGSIVHVGRDA